MICNRLRTILTTFSFSVILCSRAIAAGTENLVVKTPSQNYFQNTYEASREAFLKSAKALEPTAVIETARILRQNLGARAKEVPADNSELFLDSVYLPPASGQKERLLVLTSGTHGIEGFVGSALQTAALTENFWGQRDKNLGVLILHALNPYGFKYERRVTESNVDLNRNLDTTPALFSLKNEGYESIRPLFNPAEPAKTGVLARAIFYAKAIKAIYQHSMASLRDAVLRGQYEFPEAIFFGGQHFEPQKDILEKRLTQYGTGYGQILLIDLHTGYGARGQLHLFADQSPEMNKAYIEKVFAGRKLDYGQQKDFYQVTGSFVSFAAKLFTGERFTGKTRFAPMVFEFGTLDSQKTLGSVDSIYRMTIENQLHHHGATSPEDEKEIRRLFREMFYPSEAAWRASALQQFKADLTLALKNQKAL
jgi:hypothetical protein